MSLNACGLWGEGGAALAIAQELTARAAPSTTATYAAATASSAGARQVALTEAGAQLNSSFRGDGLVAYHRAMSLWAQVHLLSL